MVLKELLKEFDAVIGNAVDKQIEESEDVKKLQSYPGYLANQKEEQEMIDARQAEEAQCEPLWSSKDSNIERQFLEAQLDEMYEDLEDEPEWYEGHYNDNGDWVNGYFK
jgi:hypothetical protein